MGFWHLPERETRISDLPENEKNEDMNLPGYAKNEDKDFLEKTDILIFTGKQKNKDLKFSVTPRKDVPSEEKI